LPEKDAKFLHYRSPCGVHVWTQPMYIIGRWHVGFRFKICMFLSHWRSLFSLIFVSISYHLVSYVCHFLEHLLVLCFYNYCPMFFPFFITLSCVYPLLVLCLLIIVLACPTSVLSVILCLLCFFIYNLPLGCPLFTFTMSSAFFLAFFATL
jgi:hypothetical protein